MSLHRCAIALFALAVSSGAHAERKVVAKLYPLSSSNVSSGDLSDIEFAIHSALAGGRGGRFSNGRTLDPLCGPASTSTTDCIARLAGDEAVLRGQVRFVDSSYYVALIAVSGAGAVAGPVSFRIEADLSSTAPLEDALATLSLQWKGAGQSPRADDAPLPPAPREAVARVSEQQRARVPYAWMEPAGQGTAIGGALTILAGGAFEVAANRLNNNLESKFQSNSLSAADAPTYGKISRYSTLADVLFVAGSVVAVAGLMLWAEAPDAAEQR